MKVIGLTGGIGAGKSTVATILARLGAAIIDADRVGHQIYDPGTQGWELVTQEFGHEIVAADGKIDRKLLGAVVFGDPQALMRLNAIVHPLIYTEILRRLDEIKAAAEVPAVVLEAAILIEAHWTNVVDEVWIVVAEPWRVADRLERDRGMSRDQIDARVRAQLSLEQSRGHATVLIENNGSQEDLRLQVEHAWARLSDD